MAIPKSRRVPLRVHLYAGRHAETSISIDAVIEKNGDLLISGQDLGEAPLKYWHDSDYEYWLRVVSENKDAVLEALIEYCKNHGLPIPDKYQNTDETLLALLKQVYGGHVSAFGEIRSLLEEKGIPGKFANYG